MMRSLVYVTTALFVFALAFWAYRENYNTQQSLQKTSELQRKIGAAQVRLNVLRTEWAYLNRPERLRNLAEINFDRLGLLPLRAQQFGRVDEISFPVVAPLPLTNITDVAAIDPNSAPAQQDVTE